MDNDIGDTRIAKFPIPPALRESTLINNRIGKIASDNRQDKVHPFRSNVVGKAGAYFFMQPVYSVQPLDDSDAFPFCIYEVAKTPGAADDQQRLRARLADIVMNANSL